MEKELQGFRDQIDAIDDQIIALLKERIGVVKQVGALKDSTLKRACHARPGREGTMQRRIFNAFKDTDFNPLAATAMWRQIIGASTHLESPLKVAVLASTEDTLMYWHARSYFGHFSEVQMHSSAGAVLDALAAGEACIALLPTEPSYWAELLTQEAYAKYKIFAHVPFVKRTDAQMQPFAYAIADVPMEASDKDVSCFVGKDGALVLAEGFVQEHKGLPYVGTFPAPEEYGV